MAAPKRCLYCDAPLVREPLVGWVDERSGDVGGTYDICPDRTTPAGRPVGHVPMTVRMLDLLDRARRGGIVPTAVNSAERDALVLAGRVKRIEQTPDGVNWLQAAFDARP